MLGAVDFAFRLPIELFALPATTLLLVSFVFALLGGFAPLHEVGVRVDVAGDPQLGRQALRRRDVKAARVSWDGEWCVHVRAGVGYLVRLDTEEEARALVEALGFAEAQRPVPARVSLFSPEARGGAAIFGGVATFLCICAIDPRSGAWLLLVFLVAALIRIFPLRRRVVVDATGVVVGHPRARRIPATSITRIELLHTTQGLRRRSTGVVGVGLTTTDRRTTRLWTHDRGDALALRDAIAATIPVTPAVAPAPAEAIDDLPGLGRGTRTITEWIAALRRLGRGGASNHRANTMPAERLLAAVENERVAGVSRVAAAVVLSRQLAPEERTRIATFVRNEPKPLRVALERALDPDGDAAALAAALAALEAEEEEAERRRAEEASERD